MRDPMTLAYSIKRPWPQIRTKPTPPGPGSHGWFYWQMRLFGKRRYISPFVYVGKYELYFPEIIGIWHTDPLGDAGPACHGRKWWKLHVQHMSIQWSFWQNFVQKRITKCSWCRQKSSKELGRVNHSDGRGLYHSKCQSEASAAYHEHDPAQCYHCKTRRLPEINPRMPFDQRELLGGLHAQVDLGLMDMSKAISLYNNRRQEGWQ